MLNKILKKNWGNIVNLKKKKLMRTIKKKQRKSEKEYQEALRKEKPDFNNYDDMNV